MNVLLSAVMEFYTTKGLFIYFAHETYDSMSCSNILQKHENQYNPPIIFIFIAL